MHTVTFRDLRADEIECRVSTINSKGCSLLLYKDARCDMNILDETLGITGWKRSHQLINGNLFCTVEIYDDEKEEWIAKQDVGTESYTEKEKGQASDSFKRACFNLGIGRELYTAPFIRIPSSSLNLTKKGERYTTYDKFKVSKIKIENKKIKKLEILNDTTNVIVFRYGLEGEEPKQAYENSLINDVQIATLKRCIPKHNQTIEKVCEVFGISSLEKMNIIQFEKIMNMMGEN